MHDDRKGTQRERLINGMLEAAAREGYADASIAHVIKRAGVSRPTFYDYFSDKDDCFQAALSELTDRLLDEARREVRRVSGEHALQATLQALLTFVDAEPETARVLINDSMAGGPRALDIRDHSVTQLVQIVEEAEAGPSGHAVVDQDSCRFGFCIDERQQHLQRGPKGMLTGYALHLATRLVEQAVGQLAQGSLEAVVLVAEVVVEGRSRDACSLDHVRDAGVGVSLARGRLAVSYTHLTL